MTEMNKGVEKRERKKPKKPKNGTSEIHPGRRERSPVAISWTRQQEINQQLKDKRVQQIY